MERKEAVGEDQLCLGLPGEFVKYMRHWKSLSPGQMPNYTWLRALFRGLAREEGIEYDNVFDWTVLLYLQQARKRVQAETTANREATGDRRCLSLW